MKKIISLIISGILMISMVGCGDYKDKGNQEYIMMGYNYYDGWDGLTLDEIVDRTLLDENAESEKEGFADYQYGLLLRVNNEVYDEYEEFIEEFEDMEIISEDLYNDSIDMYSDYINTTSKMVKKYNNKLNEKELEKINELNKKYRKIHKRLEKEATEYMIKQFQDIF